MDGKKTQWHSVPSTEIARAFKDILLERLIDGRWGASCWVLQSGHGRPVTKLGVTAKTPESALWALGCKITAMLSGPATLYVPTKESECRED